MSYPMAACACLFLIFHNIIYIIERFVQLFKFEFKSKLLLPIDIWKLLLLIFAFNLSIWYMFKVV